MAEPPKFTATDNFQHRYAKMEVLREALIALGFKDEEIRIKATETRGLDVQLPRPITEKEKLDIYQKFVDVKNASRAAPNGGDDGDEE